MNTIQLIEVGTVAAIPASEVKVGDERLYNYYGTAVVIKIIEKSAKTLTFITCENGKYYMFDIRKSTLVAINRSGLDVSMHTPKEVYNTRKKEMVNVSEYFPVVEEVTTVTESMEKLNLEQYHIELQEKGMNLTNSKPAINPDSTYKVIVSKDRENNSIGEFEKVLTGKELEFQLFMNEVLEIVEEVTDQPENLETKLEMVTIPEVTEEVLINHTVNNNLSNNEVTVNHNKERNSVELSFSIKPDEETRSLMKAHGMRWSRYNSVWYKKNPTRSDYDMIDALTNSTLATGNSEVTESVLSPEYPEIEIDDIYSYTVPQEIQDREYESGWIFRTTKLDHTELLQKHLSQFQDEVMKVLTITDDNRITYHLKNELQSFKRKYTDAYIKWLSIKARNMNPYVTGRANYNFNKMEKLNAQQNKQLEVMGELETRIKRFINKYNKEIKRKAV